MKVKRESRLGSEFRKYIYEILTTEVKNPYITEMFTIMSVETTNDLKYADVLVSVYSTNVEKKQRTFDAIKESAGFIRKSISQKMHIRTVPEFRFKLDESMEYGAHIDKLLEKIKNDSKNWRT